MEFDLAEQRAGAREQLRIADLMSLAPGGDRVLEIGARDCYLSRRLTALYGEVTASISGFRRSSAVTSP